jgi:hypothetical protein
MRLRRVVIPGLILVLLVVSYPLARRLLSLQANVSKTRFDVAQRVREFGPAVRERLGPDFARVGISYPPPHLVLAVFKNERKVEVWVGQRGSMKLLRTYPSQAASGQLGPKLREGDMQVPEGVYAIESLNPNSLYHLSLRVGYPNEFDCERARAEGRTNLGGDIMIHGGSASIGCLAMGDGAAEDLFVLAAQTGINNMSVIISPVDFRVAGLPEKTPSLPPWTGQLYEQIRHALAELKWVYDKIVARSDHNR